MPPARRGPGAGSDASRRATARAGSRRNQVRWRLANCDVALRVQVDRRLPASARRRDRPALAVADRRERRQRRVVPLAEGPRLVDEAGVELRAGPGRRSAGRCSAGLDDELEPERPAPGSRRAAGAARRPRASAISRARTTRRGLRRSVRAASAGASAASRAGERLEPVALEVAPRSPPGPSGVRRAARPCRCRRRRRAARTRCRRRGSPIPPRSPRARERGRARGPELGDAERLVGIHEVEAVVDDPSPLRGRRLRRADVEARGRPAASRRRSPRPDRPAAMSASASSIARPVLPVAVGPPMTTSGARCSGRASSPPSLATGPAGSASHGSMTIASTIAAVPARSAVDVSGSSWTMITNRVPSTSRMFVCQRSSGPCP